MRLRSESNEVAVPKFNVKCCRVVFLLRCWSSKSILCPFLFPVPSCPACQCWHSCQSICDPTGLAPVCHVPSPPSQWTFHPLDGEGLELACHACSCKCRTFKGRHLALLFGIVLSKSIPPVKIPVSEQSDLHGINSACFSGGFYKVHLKPLNSSLQR